MTGWTENHSADDLVSACMIRLYTDTLKRCMLLSLPTDRGSLEENEWREKGAFQVGEVSFASARGASRCCGSSRIGLNRISSPLPLARLLSKRCKGSRS